MGKVSGEMSNIVNVGGNAIARLATQVLASLVQLVVSLRRQVAIRLVSDRGDVPGWVLVTVMTAGLVTGLWMVADDQLTALLSKAINSVSN
jgi:hypothetical protein